MACYFIAHITIHDAAEYKRYEDGFDRVFAEYEGRVIVVDDGPAVLEGRWSHKRIVVIRFPSEDEARRWYESEKYQKLAQHRIRSSEATVLLATGRD